MQLHLPDFLSYLIRPEGESVAFVPAEDEFSIKQLQDAVGALPELVCFTSEGYSLFRDRDGESKKLAVNEIATAIWRDAVRDRTEMIFGPVFLAHPAHIPAYWRQIYREPEPMRSLRRLFNQTCVQVA